MYYSDIQMNVRICNFLHHSVHNLARSNMLHSSVHIGQFVLLFQPQPEKTSRRKKCYKLPPQQQETADSTLILVPGSFDVILLVDKKETAG
jgi:hypothetical protein